jgi:hypothetical protein
VLHDSMKPPAGQGIGAAHRFGIFRNLQFHG